MVILKADDSSLFVLNGVGTVVWEAADGGTPLSGIVDDVCREYDIDRETALRDVTTFVDALVSHGVMRTSPTAMVGDDTPTVGREGANG
jgi:hypothetical protein